MLSWQKDCVTRMLRDAWDIVPAESSPSNLRTARIPVFEAFIRMFLDSANAIVKRGLAGGYGRVEENERFFKGKLIVAEHIRQNSVRRDRFFVAHDVFSLDNPANRILRSGLEWALGKARLEANKRLARQLLAACEDVPARRIWRATSPLAREADSAILVYPRHDALGGIGENPPFFTTPGDADVRVKFVDLENPTGSIKEIFDL